MANETGDDIGITIGERRSSWDTESHPYRRRDLDQIVARYAFDALSMPAGHAALRGREEIRAWYGRRLGDFDMHSTSEVQSVDVIGDLAITSGIFRVTRAPERDVSALDHAGRFLSVMKRVDGEWLLWRDMDQPSPDADVFYSRLPRGW